jgi:hypothetical protein
VLVDAAADGVAVGELFAADGADVVGLAAADGVAVGESFVLDEAKLFRPVSWAAFWLEVLLVLALVSE